MTQAKDLDYTIHHLCVYDKDPRQHMWPYLRWHHGITGYFTGDTFHIADEGHADYTFLGCGGRAFQIQLEAPPYQFKYEQEWYAKHGNGYNHICWIVNDARQSYEQLQADGAIVMQEFQPFPTYDGFVMSDPEGRWIEIMEYTHDTFRVQEFTNQPAGECGLRMIGFVEVVSDLDAMSDWYQKALDLRVQEHYQNGAGGQIHLVDKFYDARERNTVMVLRTARGDEERAAMAGKGPYISAILYEAKDVERAFADGEWAGMEAIAAPAEDPLTGLKTAKLREPSGNLVELREAASS
jgi:catechol 2,3-dioxygenase-like lactoylglutathione lyase family enzyme